MHKNRSHLLILVLRFLVFNSLSYITAKNIDKETTEECSATHWQDNWVTSCGPPRRSNIGVDIDFSFNETLIAGSKGRSSSPGCPKSVNGIPWVYYGSPQKCLMSGRRNECKLGSTLLPVEGSTFGKCVCNCLVDRDFPKERKVETENFIHCKGTSGNLRFRKGEYGYGQIYDKRRSKCFNVGFREECNLKGERVTGLTDGLIDCGWRGVSELYSFYMGKRNISNFYFFQYYWCIIDGEKPALATRVITCTDQAGYIYSTELNLCLRNTVITKDAPFGT